MAQMFRYHPSEQGEYVTGLPAGPITDEWLAETAAVLRCSVDALSAEIAAYKRADGKPLYTATARGKDELGAAGPPPAPAETEGARPAKPKVPLGTRAGD